MNKGGNDMSDTMKNVISDDELNEVVGGTNISMTEDIEKGSKEQKPGSKDLPFLCRAKKCGKTFYISQKGANKIMCPHCKAVYTVAG